MKIFYKFLSVMLVSGINANVFAQNVSVTVSPSDTRQTVYGFGGGIVYYQNWIPPHENKEALYDTIFSGLGLSALRMGNWAQDLSEEGVKDIDNDAEIVSAAKKRLGNNFFIEMSSWSAPKELKANGKIEGSRGGVKASLKKENGNFVYDKFGEWWRNSLEVYHSKGIYPDYISLQNEPDMDADYEATLFNPDESNDVASYGKALKAVHNAIKNMNNKPKILGPEVLGVGWNQTQKYVEKLDKTLLDGYCFHYYHSGSENHKDDSRYSFPDEYYNSMTGLAKDLADKPQFMTENCSMRDREKYDEIYLAWLIANSFNINKVVSYIHWNLTWGDTGGGCVNVENPWDKSKWTTTEGFRVNNEYHGLRHYSKFVRPGWICIGSSSTNNDVVSTAFKSQKGDSITVVLVNKGNSNLKATLSKNTLGDVNSGYVVQTVSDNNVWSKVVSGFSVDKEIDLPKKSITTLVLGPDRIMPTVTWAEKKSKNLLKGESNCVEWEVSETLEEEVNLCWNYLINVDSVSASSEWENEDGTFGWYVENILQENGGRWAAKASSDEWVELILNDGSAIDGIYVDEVVTDYGRIKSFEIQYFSEGEWKTCKAGTTIGEKCTIVLDMPIVTNKVRLFIKEAGAININYIKVLAHKNVLSTKESLSSAEYSWIITEDFNNGEGFFSIELKDGTIVSKSDIYTILPQATNGYLTENDKINVFSNSGYIYIITDKIIKDFKLFDINGLLVKSIDSVVGTYKFKALPGVYILVAEDNRHKIVVK